MLVYADPAHLADWVDTIPENATVLIREASRLVRKATAFDVYDTDPAHKPTDPWVIEAFRDATCRHAAYWAENDINPLTGVSGLEQVETASSIAGASVSVDTSQTAAVVAEMVASLSGLIEPALDILRDAELASTRPGVW